MAYFRKHINSILMISFIIIASIVFILSRIDSLQLQASYIDSSSAMTFYLRENASCLMIIDGNEPYHYCSSLPDIPKGGVQFDSSLANYQSVLYANGNISEFSKIFSSLDDTKNLNSMYIEVNPYKIKNDDFVLFEDFISNHPEIRLIFCLPVKSIDEWRMLVSDRKFMEYVNSCVAFCSTLIKHDQVTILFPNQYSWIACDHTGFTDDWHCTLDLAQYIAELICNGKCYINRDNVLKTFSKFISETARELTMKYPDLSGENIAIFGDSINGNFDPLYSISNFMSSMSGATLYNFAIGGASAYSNPGDYNYSLCMLAQINSVISGDLSDLSPDCTMHKNYENLPPNISFDKILLEFGLNDYMCNFPINDESNPYNIKTMQGALRVGINILKDQYPEATIYMVLPNRISFFEYGTVQLNNNGVLDEYVEALTDIAEEFDLPIIDCYHLPGWDNDNLSQYSLDGIHPNELGRIELAKKYLSGIQ